MKNRGMTYIEIIISVLILAIIVPILINVFQLTNIESKRGRELLQLPYITQAYIEEVKSAPISTFQGLPYTKRKEYRGYFFEHTIRSYWNGHIDIPYYIVDQVDDNHLIVNYGSNKDSPYVVINAMKYRLDKKIDISRLELPNSANIIIYCTSENLDAINTEGLSNITKIIDSNSRLKVIFNLDVQIFKSLDDKTPILAIETLFEKEI